MRLDVGRNGILFVQVARANDAFRKASDFDSATWRLIERIFYERAISPNAAKSRAISLCFLNDIIHGDDTFLPILIDKMAISMTDGTPRR